MIGQVTSKFFGGNKPTMPWANTAGLPGAPGYTVPPPGQTQTQTQTTLGGDPGDKGTGGAGAGQEPWTPPVSNPYRQKAENWTSVGNIFNKYVGIEQQFPVQGDVNLWHENVVNPLADELATYGITLFASVDMNGIVSFNVNDPYGDSQIFDTMGKLTQWAQSKVGEYSNRADDYDQFGGFQTGFEEWAANYEAGETQIDPFADPNGWDAVVQSIFGDMANLPDMQDLLIGMYNMMPVWEYTADALPNLSAPERMTKFFDDLKANGFDMDQMEGGLDQTLRNWLYKMAQELRPSRMFDQLGFDLTTWNQMTNTQIAEITKMLSRKSVLDDADIRKYISMKMRQVKQINRDEHNYHLNILAEKGITHGGAMIRSVQDLYQRLGDAEMNVTADVFMRSMELAEQGKWEAMGTLAQITDTQADLLLGIGGLKASLFGQYFDFIADIGRISASEYATKTESYIAQASLKLKYDLGVAGLEIDKYVSDRGLDLEGLKLEYDNYWRDRGANLEEKQAEFDNAIAAWQTSAMMAEMINSGRTERLVQMASLALKAQAGDREAWGMYQQLALQERLEQRGMDIDVAQGLSDLTYQYYTFGETMDFNRWATKYEGMLKKELLRMGIEGEKDLLRLKDELEDDGFWGSILKVVGSVAKLGLILFKKKPEDDTGTDTGNEGSP